ncbi:hypothetical protein [Serratia fonticola]|uniref:hypothetical protein n=1 Tax=Serratia fonticola TaxID=47917 RepID=UPI0034C614FA
MKMNEHPNNVVTQFFAWLAAIASAAGITTQDLIFIAFGAVGVIISVLSFALGRIDARARRLNEQRRTELYAAYLKRRIDRPTITEDDADIYVSLPGGERKV